MQVNAMAAHLTLPGPEPDPGRILPWQAHGLCRLVADPEVFYPEPAEPAREALALCAVCPVQTECLSHALTFPEEYGVWGGTTEQERREHIRALRRARTAVTGTPLATPDHQELDPTDQEQGVAA